MKIRFLLCVLIGFACLGQTCTPPAAAPTETCMTSDEITNIPPGDATGTGLSGDYVAVSSTLASCAECAQNACTGICDSAEAVVPEGAVLRVTQSDGTLTFGTGDEVATGGVNADGTFRTGITLASRNSAGE